MLKYEKFSQGFSGYFEANNVDAVVSSNTTSSAKMKFVLCMYR